MLDVVVDLAEPLEGVADGNVALAERDVLGRVVLHPHVLLGSLEGEPQQVGAVVEVPTCHAEVVEIVVGSEVHQETFSGITHSSNMHLATNIYDVAFCRLDRIYAVGSGARYEERWRSSAASTPAWKSVARLI